MRRLPEPWRIKVVEPTRLLSREEREDRLVKASFSLFGVPSEDIFIDLFTDSGTSAMSDGQWAGMMQGDEAYAGGRNFYNLKQTILDVFGFANFLPVHQGRVAENLLFSSLVKPGMIVPSNGHFDTTRAHIEINEGVALDLGIPEARDPAVLHPFKGNIDLRRVRTLFEETPRGKIPLAMLTLTNNVGGGQPVSMANIRGMAALCREHRVPFYIDACRFAENAWFIKEREDGYKDRSIAAIVKEVFSFSDGCTMSAKKDGLANIGGFIASRDEALIGAMTNRLILLEGFPTYGGLAGRDLEVVARGLREVLDERYLRFRVEQVAAFGETLRELGVPIIVPTGGHAIYVDGRRFLPHIDPAMYPAQAACIALYREGGIRASEVGSVMLGHKDPETGQLRLPALDLLRLAIPRRVYTDTHLDYVADVFREIAAHKERIKGLRITYETPVMRHFTARFEEVPTGAAS